MNIIKCTHKIINRICYNNKMKYSKINLMSNKNNN